MQQIGLPIVPSNDSEIPVYLDAKKRIERKLPFYEICGFLLQFGRTLTSENKQKTIENSKDIYICSSLRAWAQNYALNETSDIKSALELAYKLPSKREHLNLTFNVGIRLDEKDVESYATRRKEIREKIIQNIGLFADMAKLYNMGLLIENAPPLSVEPAMDSMPTLDTRLEDFQVKRQYHGFTTLQDLRDVRDSVGRTNLGINLDLGAYALTMSASKIAENRMKKLAAQLHGFSSWQDYMSSYGTLKEWVKIASEYQLSNSTGIGIHLKDKQLIERLGSMGTLGGALSSREIRETLRTARERNEPCVLELQHEPTLDYKEDEKFLDSISE